jgi:outer membrane protein assembly factor BamE (lipoprotein component of BamABCDE complex)
LVLVLVAGCSSLPWGGAGRSTEGASSSPAAKAPVLGARGSGLFSPYRVDIPQGNYLDRNMVEQVRPGMTRDQVRFALGTPLHTDPFRPDRWDYVFRFQHASLDAELRKQKLKANIAGAKTLGVAFASKAKAAGIASVVFDRSGAPYHGKVKIFADAAREGGLQF